jgi:integrase
VIRGEETQASAGVKHRIKSMFNLMLDYALEYEIVDRNYARSFNTPDKVLKEEENNKKPHMPFTDEEMEILWSHVDDMRYVDVILIQCYSGWRPQELGLIKLDDVDMDAWTFIGGMKSDAGVDRIVPIHPRIRHLVERKYKEAIALDSKYLINKVGKFNYTKNGTRLRYDNYRKRFINIRTKLGLNPEHRTHDPRMHFVTMAKKYKVDEYAIKYIVGHTITDVTEKVYTKREVDWLHEEIRKIK